MKKSWLRCGAVQALLLMCVLFQPAASAAWQGTLQTSSADGRVVAFPSPGGARVEVSGTAAVDLPVSSSIELSSLSSLKRGWIVAGSLKDAAGGETLRLFRGSRGGVQEVPAPGHQRDFLRLRPILMARDGQLLGLVWLEGGTMQSLGVWASVWRDGRWSRPEQVAAPGPGSQLALAGTVLADGTWVLVWSGFDGEDDEILVSRRVAGAWQPAKRLHENNAVFDITPTVLAFEEDALVAWSRYDGQTYRLLIARLDGDRLETPRVIGESGSVLPRFVPGAGSPPDLVYYAAERSGWLVAELDRQAKVVRRAAVTADSDHRPILSRSSASPALVWRHEERHVELSFREEEP